MGTTVFNAFDNIYGVKNSQLFYLVSEFDRGDEGFENWVTHRFDRAFGWFVSYLKRSFRKFQDTIQNGVTDDFLFVVFVVGSNFYFLEYWQGFHDVTIGNDDRNHAFFFSFLSSNYDV